MEQLEKALEKKFEPVFEIVEDNLVSMRCRCACATPGACPPPDRYSSVEYISIEVDSKYKL